MPQKPARQAFVNPRPISRQHWQPSRVRGSTRPIRLLLQLAGIQWEGETDKKAPRRYRSCLTNGLSVHHADFPQIGTVPLCCAVVTAGTKRRPSIVPASAVEPDNLDGRIGFDDTVDKDDVTAFVQISRIIFHDRLMYPRLQQYLSGTGNRGGPLVTTANKTVQSDLRLFESDHNATIEEYCKVHLLCDPVL